MCWGKLNSACSVIAYHQRRRSTPGLGGSRRGPTPAPLRQGVAPRRGAEPWRPSATVPLNGAGRRAPHGVSGAWIDWARLGRCPHITLPARLAQYLEVADRPRTAPPMRRRPASTCGGMLPPSPFVPTPLHIIQERSHRSNR